MDFLTFKRFISIEVLIVFYYLGAVVLPLAAWAFAAWLVRRFALADSAYQAGKAMMRQALSLKHRLYLLFLFLFSFLFMELMWRMMFEFLIAYMQMRDALVAG